MAVTLSSAEFLHANVDYSVLKQVRTISGANNRYIKFKEEQDKIRKQLAKTVGECMTNGLLWYDYKQEYENENTNLHKLTYSDIATMWGIEKSAVSRMINSRMSYTIPVLKSLSKSFRVSANEVALGETIPISLPRRIGTLAFYLSQMAPSHQELILKEIKAIQAKQKTAYIIDERTLMRSRFTEFSNSKFRHPYDLGGAEFTGRILHDWRRTLGFPELDTQESNNESADIGKNSGQPYQLRITMAVLFFCFEFGISLDYIICQDYTDCAPLVFKDDNLFCRYPDHCFYLSPEDKTVKRIISVYLQLNEENKQKAFMEIMYAMVSQLTIYGSRTNPHLICNMNTIIN